MKTITLEEIYADPHVLEPLFAAGEPVEVMRAGESMGDLVPRKRVLNEGKPKLFNVDEHRAWFLEMHGPDAYRSTRSTADVFDEVRRGPLVNGHE